MGKITVPKECRGSIDDIKALLDNPKLSEEVETIFTELSAGKKFDSVKINALITSVEDLVSHKTSAHTIARFRKCIYGLADQITVLKKVI